MEDMMSPEKSFNSYREALKSCSPPCVPFLANTLSDLTFIHEGNKETELPKINVDKRELIYQVISNLQVYQVDKYSEIRKLEPLSTYLQVLPRYPEDTQYELSLWHEPREVVSKFPPVLGKFTYNAILSQGFSPADVAEMIDLIVESHVNDPRWVHICKDETKRRRLMKSTHFWSWFNNLVDIKGHSIRWCSKHSEYIFIKHEPNPNPNAPKKICAVAVWLYPGTV